MTKEQLQSHIDVVNLAIGQMLDDNGDPLIPQFTESIDKLCELGDFLQNQKNALEGSSSNKKL